MTWTLLGTSSLAQLLKSESFTLADVLDDATYIPTLRKNAQSLLNYLMTDSSIGQLLDWSLTSLYKDHPKLLKISRLAVSTLIFPNPRLQGFLRGSAIFLQRIADYPKSADFSEPRVSGNYGAIVLEFVRSTKGAFLESIPGLPDFLLGHMGFMGIRALFVKLILECAKEFGADVALMERLTGGLGAPGAHGIVAAIRELIKQRQSTTTFFNSATVVENILNYATTVEDPLAAVDAFEVVERIIARHPRGPAAGLPARFYDAWASKSGTITCATGAALRVFRRAPPEIVVHILDLPVNTFLCQGIFTVVSSLPPAELTSLADSIDLPRRIMEVLPKTVANPQLTDLATIIESDVPGWKEFQAGFVAARISDRSKYCGAKETKPVPVEEYSDDAPWIAPPEIESEDSYEEDKDEQHPESPGFLTTPDDGRVIFVPVPPDFVPPPPDEDEEEDGGGGTAEAGSTGDSGNPDGGGTGNSGEAGDTGDSATGDSGNSEAGDTGDSGATGDGGNSEAGDTGNSGEAGGTGNSGTGNSGEAGGTGNSDTGNSGEAGGTGDSGGPG